jgi:hypothetical protein
MSLLPALFHDTSAREYAGLGLPKRLSELPEPQERKRDVFREIAHEIDEKTGEPIPPAGGLSMLFAASRPVFSEPHQRIVAGGDYPQNWAGLFPPAAIAAVAGANDSLDAMLKQAAKAECGVPVPQVAYRPKTRDELALLSAHANARLEDAHARAQLALQMQVENLQRRLQGRPPLTACSDKEVKDYHSRLQKPGCVTAAEMEEMEYRMKLRKREREARRCPI